jgi:hypothetical protein
MPLNDSAKTYMFCRISIARHFGGAVNRHANEIGALKQGYILVLNLN